MKTKPKTRNEIISECTTAVVGCFQHYADVPMTTVEKAAIKLALNKLLPERVSTKRWMSESDAYHEQLKREQRA